MTYLLIKAFFDKKSQTGFAPYGEGTIKVYFKLAAWITEPSAVAKHVSHTNGEPDANHTIHLIYK